MTDGIALLSLGMGTYFGIGLFAQWVVMLGERRKPTWKERVVLAIVWPIYVIG